LGLQEQLAAAVARAYAAAGVYVRETDIDSLANTYAAWAEGADDGVVQRLERALARSLGVYAA
jgi:hypothetical protein